MSVCLCIYVCVCIVCAWWVCVCLCLQYVCSLGPVPPLQILGCRDPDLLALALGNPAQPRQGFGAGRGGGGAVIQDELGPLQGRLKSDLQGARGECRGKRVLEKIIGQRPGRAAQAPPCGGRSWRIRFPTSPSICSAPTFHAAESSSCRAEASARRELPAPWSLHAVSHTRGAGLLQAASQRAAFCGFCGDTAVNSGQASPAGALGQPRPWRPGRPRGRP